MESFRCYFASRRTTESVVARAGFTLIELMVVVGIVVIVAGVVFSSRTGFNNSVLLSNTSYDVALTLRDAETYGLGTRATGGQSSAGYGVHFDKNSSRSYILFNDSAPGPSSTGCHGVPVNGSSAPNAYPGDCIYNATGATDSTIATYQIGNNVLITDLCIYNGGWQCANSNGSTLSTLDITFSRPNAQPFFAANGVYTNNPGITSACIVINAKTGGGTKYINIYQGGQIALATSCTAGTGGLGNGGNAIGPTCTLNASPATVSQGSPTTLSWTSANATDISINSGVGVVSPLAAGSVSATPSSSQNYTMTAIGAGGASTCQAHVSVIPLPTCTLSLPASVTSGNSAPLTWTSSGATSMVVNNGVGSLAPASGGSTSVYPTVNPTTYIGTVTNSAGSTGTCTASITVNPPPPPPSCTLSANPVSFFTPNATTLSWSTQNAVSISISPTVGSVSPVASGSVSATPSSNTTYTALVTSATGVTGNCSTSVTVSPPPIPTCTFSASPSIIGVGSNDTLSWTSTYAASASISPTVGAVTPASSGSVTVSPATSQTYTYTATNSSGSGSCQATVNVVQVPNCTISSSSITNGQAATLNYTSNYAQTFVVNNGAGSLSPVSGGTKSVSPTVTTTYTGTVTNSVGVQATCTGTVTVVAAPSCSLTANPTSITAPASTVLTWSSSGASTMSISPTIGAVTPASGGTVSVAPSSNTTYTGTATNSLGATATCSASVTVSQPAAPSCTLSSAPNPMTIGNPSTMSYTTTNATTFSINQSIGAKTPGSGSFSVNPSVTTTYTGTVTNAVGVQATCNNTLTVNSPTPTCSLVPNPTSYVNPGSSVITYSSTNATSFTLNPGNISLSTFGGTTSVSPSVTTTYTGSVSGSGGSNTCTATVTVNSPPATCNLSLSPGSYTTPGSSTLSWTTTNATSLSINQGIGSVTVPSSSTTVSPTVTTTYTGSVNGPGGPNTCTATLNVSAPSLPNCSLSPSSQTVVVGGFGPINWASQNATSMSISPTIGAVTPVSGGTANPAVSCVGTVTYTGTATGPGGSANCSATVTGTQTLPSYVASISTGLSSPRNIGINAGYAWVASTGNGAVVTYNIGAGTPTYNGSDTGHMSLPRVIAFSGSYAYVGDSSLSAFGVYSSPTPTLSSTKSTGASTHPVGLATQGSYLYVADSSGVFRVFDISSPSSPVASLTYSASQTGINTVAVMGANAYVGTPTGNKITVFNVGNLPRSLTQFSSFSVYGLQQVKVYGNDLYVVKDMGDPGVSDGVYIYDLSGVNARAPVLVGSIQGQNGPTAIAFTGTKAFITNQGDGSMTVADISNPAAPTIIGSVSTGLSSPRDVQTNGNYIYIVDAINSSLVTYSYANACP